MLLNAWSLQGYLAGVSLLALLVSVCAYRSTRWTYGTIQLGLLGALAGLYQNIWPNPVGAHFAWTTTTQSLSAFLIIWTGLFLCYSRPYQRAHAIQVHEFYLLVMWMLIGAIGVITAMHALPLYISIEWVALPGYAMILIGQTQATQERLASEAAMKYFIMGALASVGLLFALGWLYARLGHLSLFAPDALALMLHDPLILLAFVVLVCFIAMKWGLAPFHFWVPDVYQASTWPVLGWLSTFTKWVWIILAVRLLGAPFGVLLQEQGPLMICLAWLSWLIGHLGACTQDHLRRWLAYASIAQLGYLAMAMIAIPEQGVALIAFYAFSYLLAAALLIGWGMLWQRAGHSLETWQDLKGLATTHPIAAASIVLVLLSWIGLPPTLGFFAKIWLLQYLWSIQAYVSIVMIVLWSVVAAFYYLKPIQYMYFESADENNAPVTYWPHSIWERCLLIVHTILLLGLSIAPYYAWELVGFVSK